MIVVGKNHLIIFIVKKNNSLFYFYFYKNIFCRMCVWGGCTQKMKSTYIPSVRTLTQIAQHTKAKERYSTQHAAYSTQHTANSTAHRPQHTTHQHTHRNTNTHTNTHTHLKQFKNVFHNFSSQTLYTSLHV